MECNKAQIYAAESDVPAVMCSTLLAQPGEVMRACTEPSTVNDPDIQHYLPGDVEKAQPERNAKTHFIFPRTVAQQDTIKPKGNILEPAAIPLEHQAEICIHKIMR